MLSLGITGGIASGKTQFTRFLQTLTGGRIFAADACVKKNLEENSTVIAAIRQNFGKDFINDTGIPDREKLRDLIFRDDSKREYLESLLHPLVWNACQEALLLSKKENSSFLLADIPLIYETGSQQRFDIMAVVACSPQTQMQRMTTIRHIPENLASRMIHSQLPIAQKAALADHVIWNDGSLEALKTQAEMLGNHLLSKHGR